MDLIHVLSSNNSIEKKELLETILIIRTHAIANSKVRDILHQDHRFEVHHEVIWPNDYSSKSDWVWDDSHFHVLPDHLRSSESKPQPGTQMRLVLINCGHDFGWGQTEKERDLIEAVSMIFLVGCDVHTSRSL